MTITAFLEAAKKATEYDTPELLDSEIDDLADDVQRMQESAEKYGEDPYGGLRGLSRDLARMRELREYRNAAKEIEELVRASGVLYQCIGVLADEHPKRELLLDTLAWMKGTGEKPDFDKLLPFRAEE